MNVQVLPFKDVPTEDVLSYLWYIRDHKLDNPDQDDYGHIIYLPNRACAERYISSLLKTNHGDNIFAHSPDDFCLVCDYCRSNKNWTYYKLDYPVVIPFKDFVS